MNAQPVSEKERILSLDIIRGIALLGILLVNMPTFSTPDFIRQMYLLPLEYSGLDQGIRLFFDLFVQAKFYPIFSFLFGAGFYLFINRVEQRDLPSGPLFSRRLLVLLLFGLSHLIFFWHGDILHTYALTGFLLLLFRGRSDGAVLGWAFSLLLMIQLLLASQLMLGPGTYLGEQQATGRALWGQALNMYQDAPYAQWLLYRLQTEVPVILSNAPGLIPSVLPFFLFGLYAGRRGILQNPENHQVMVNRVWKVSLFCAIPLTLLVALLHFGVLPLGNSQMIAHQLLISLNGVALCFFYLASLVRLLQRPVWQQRLQPLAAVGRMALTNYLLQTILAVAIIHFFDLFGRLSLTAGLLLSLAIFALQVMASGLWLRRFRMGPMEWLWRTLTYGKAQPLRRS